VSAAPCPADTPPLLTAREVNQVLREITLGRRAMTPTCDQHRLHSGLMVVEVEGWRISLLLDGGELGYCADAVCPDGRQWALDSGARYGTDPVALLSTWEHTTLGSLLKNL
jgi:hypothetical protein